VHVVQLVHKEIPAGTERLAQGATKVALARRVPSVLRGSEDHLAKTGEMANKAQGAGPAWPVILALLAAEVHEVLLETTGRTV
jgi:hypothetical protein